MTSIQPFGTANRGISRQAGRALNRMENATTVEIARVNSRGDVHASKVDVVSDVTQRALQGAAFLTQVEAQLGAAVPMAVSRLEGIANIGALGLSQLVMDTVTDLRRF